MIFLVFTQAGLTEIQTTACEQRATIWHNPDLLSETQQESLNQQGVTLNSLTESVDVTDDKAVYQALQHIEKHTQDTEIYIEMA